MHGVVIAGRWFVIAGLTRNPVVAWHWIPDVETPDPGSSPGQALIRGRDDKLDVRDDKTKGRRTFAESTIASPAASLSLAKTVSRISELNDQRRPAQ